jgi:7,8-dihydropterin-6-yl-methyl-4-(beta-D-ribofuranosyl)aminobenzene 5'-phosphate synthase
MSGNALEATILRDNVAVREDLSSGHGLAMLVRIGDHAALFDAGDSAETWENADALGIDPAEVGHLALSHGHYDHTNGLPHLLERGGKLTVVAHPAVFEPRWADRAGGRREYIGPPATREELEAMGADFQLSNSPVDLIPGLSTTGEIPRVSDLAPRSPHLLVERDGQTVEDDFVDDLSLLASLDGGSVLLTGCAHAGLVNIVEQMISLTGQAPTAVAGGTHLARESEDRIRLVARTLHDRGVRQIVPLHCSGDRGADLLAEYFPGEVLSAGVGDMIAADSTGHIRIV